MFTGKKISLSQIASCTSIETQLIRDCDFSFVGKIPSKLSNRLVPCGKLEHFNEVASKSGIVGIITTAELASYCPNDFGLAISVNPLRTAYSIHSFLCDLKDFHWVSFPTKISSSARVHPSAVIAGNDVVIGENCIVHANAVIYPRTILGNGSSIGAGTIVGCDGFDIDVTQDTYRILPQAGGVLIGADVDIQAKCTIVRSTFGGFTEIGDESKLDCQVHLAHDCKVGRRVRITACAEISGRVEIQDNAYLGPNVSVSNGVLVGENAHVTIGSVVTRDVPSGARVSGNFAIEHSKWLNLMRKVR